MLSVINEVERHGHMVLWGREMKIPHGKVDGKPHLFNPGRWTRSTPYSKTKGSFFVKYGKWLFGKGGNLEHRPHSGGEGCQWLPQRLWNGTGLSRLCLEFWLCSQLGRLTQNALEDEDKCQLYTTGKINFILIGKMEKRLVGPASFKASPVF